MQLWGISPSAGSGAGAATTPRDNVSTKTNLMETFILRAEGGGSENGCPRLSGLYPIRYGHTIFTSWSPQRRLWRKDCFPLRFKGAPKRVTDALEGDFSVYGSDP